MMANYSKVVSDLTSFIANFSSLVGAMNFLPMFQRPIALTLDMGKASTD
jgi:hypothetical protein